MRQGHRIAAWLAAWVLVVVAAVAAQGTLEVGDEAPEFPPPPPRRVKTRARRSYLSATF